MEGAPYAMDWRLSYSYDMLVVVIDGGRSVWLMVKDFWWGSSL